MTKYYQPSCRILRQYLQAQVHRLQFCGEGFAGAGLRLMCGVTQEADGQAIKAVLRSAPAQLTRGDASFPAAAVRNGAELAPAQGARVPSRLLAQSFCRS